MVDVATGEGTTQAADTVSTAAIHAHLERLVAILESQIDLCRTFLSVCENERQAVVHSDAAALAQVSKNKEYMVASMRRCEERRLLTLKRLAPALGTSAELSTVSRLAERVGAPYSKKLRELGQTLAEEVGRMRRTNQRNRELIGHARRMVKDSLSLIEARASAGGTYHRAGRLRPVSRSGKLVSSTI
jgi:flagellar biosynthesis/type III secretory pathway chaperone